MIYYNVIRVPVNDGQIAYALIGNRQKSNPIKITVTERQKYEAYIRDNK